MTDTGSQIPQDQPAMERGLLDLSVAMSTRNITAGKQFAIFVLVKNPFDKPVWVRQVHVSLPSELKLAGSEEKRRQKDNEKDDRKNDFQREKDAQIVRLETKLDALNAELSKILTSLENKGTLEESTKSFLNTIKTKITQIQNELENLTRGNQANIHIADDSNVSYFKVLSKKANIHVSNDAKIAYFEIREPTFAEISAQARKVDLESSLPRNVALQPGSTVVYTAILYVERSLVFAPSQYRLQFNVNYSFHPTPVSSPSEQYEKGEEGIFTNTVAYELSIRPSVSSVIIGAGIGGFTGAIARLLQITPTEKWQIFSSTDFVTFLITIVVTVILSGIAVVFMVRKSEAQSFVSVEDFWGGLLIGFLVGYTGTSFFEQLTGVTNPSINVPSPKISPRP
ncbi:MAG: hypothetical protein ACK5C4_04195 [Pseudanabaena sp.]|jgi:hypothetical protein